MKLILGSKSDNELFDKLEGQPDAPETREMIENLVSKKLNEIISRRNKKKK